jgi:exo-beta-1,3-glucanase (GH17 family)
MHSALYPLGNGGDPTRMAEVLETDLKQLSGKFTHIRTYHSQYYGVGIAAFAAKHNLKLYMGLTQFENKEWNEIEIQAALDAVKNFPDTVEAILIGNENLNIGGGDKSVDALIGDIQAFKYRLDQAGLVDKVLVGTTQRVSTMLDKSAELDKLAQNADLLGVNIYPFFTKGWDSSNPVDLLDIQWNQVVERYGDFKNKLRVTETGWPTSGDAPAAFPENLPSVENQKIYFQGLKNWQPKVKTGPAFWFMAYDRRLDDPFMISNPEYERHFGLFTTDNQDKWDL